MEIAEGQRFAKALLYKHRKLRQGFWGLGGLFLLLWLLEMLAAWTVLLLLGEKPAALLGTDTLLWRTVQAILGIPLGAIWICFSWNIWKQCTQAAGMLQPENAARCKNGKMLVLAIQNAALRTILLAAVPLFWYGAFLLAQESMHHTDGALWLFGAAQLILLGVLWLFFWGYVCLGLWCVPFVWFAHPEMPAWKIPLTAMAAMRGHRTRLLLLLLWYTVQCLPLVTIPWVLPQAGVAVTVFCNIRVQLLQQRQTIEKQKNSCHGTP